MINRRFTLFWTSRTVSGVGDRITELALPLIAVVTLASTPAQVGLLTAAVWLPNLLGVLIGAWADRQPHRRRLLVAADLLSAAALLSLPVAYGLGAVTLTQLFVVALLTGLGQVIGTSAYQAFFVSLVERHQYVVANSRLSVSQSTSQVAGPALGGYLIQTVTAPIAVLVDAVSFLVSAMLLGRIDAPPAPVRPERARLATDIRDGLRYVFAHPHLRAALACVTTLNFFTFIAQALAILFASRELGLPGGLIGLTLGLGALGALLGALVAPRLTARFGVGRVIVAGAILFPAPIAVMAFAHGSRGAVVATIALAQVVSGFGVMLFDINLNAVQAAVTADAMRSRVSGVFATINYGVRPFGAAVGGVLGGVLGLRPTLLLAAAGGTLGVLWLLRSPIPPIRVIDDELAPAA